jgi:cell division protease FtsH
MQAVQHRDEIRGALAAEWRRLARVATAVALITSPALFATLYVVNGWPLGWSVLVTFVAVVAFRGLIDVVAYRFIPRPSLYGADEALKAEDVVFRRRRWYWRTRFRRLTWLVLVLVALLVGLNLILRLFGHPVGLFDTLPEVRDLVATAGPSLIILLLQLPLFFLFNFLILFGPLLAFGVMQMKAYEPGDADWGVRVEDVRGQKEPKEEVQRIITLWQAGDEFKKAGGKPERGLLLIGAPGTGKTMLSKAIATSFNSPIMTMPGSGFAQTFIGMDVIVVMILIARARRLARKWGGQCMVFIDEIDAVGMRRASLGGAAGPMTPHASEHLEDYLFHGPWGALTASGDLVLETRAWRERVFAARAEAPRATYPPTLARLSGRIQDFIFPGGMGGMGMLALNQLLVQMDGMDNPPFVRKWMTKKLNTFLDALYVVPQRIGPARLRVRPPKPRAEQVYFIGATNVPIERLDPALIRPGRLGRHIWFRTPTAEDRKDIFDLYLAKVSHDADLDTPKRREELARMTGGYSPAMIEQVCSMALTYAHADGRGIFEWRDVIEAMTTIESGTAVGIDYVPEETRAVAIHEAGHAVASHVYMQDVLSTRLSIRMRGGSLGHHQAIEKEERFSSWRHEDVGKLVWTLGAMAAEHVFYGENSRGVGGDVGSATTLAALMVGMWSMGPEPIDLNGARFAGEEERREVEERYMQRFERIGMQIMNRSRGAREQGDAIAAILGDPAKKSAAARILGQCYLTAVCLIRHNREEVARIADVLVERKELHGDAVVELLDAAVLEAPPIDLRDETIWPKL